MLCENYYIDNWTGEVTGIRPEVQEADYKLYVERHPRKWQLGDFNSKKLVLCTHALF